MVTEDFARTDAHQSVVHGDYRIDNHDIRYAKEPIVRAVLDWELSTLGDPLADFTYVAMAWVTHNEGRSGVMDLDRAGLGYSRAGRNDSNFIAPRTNRDGVPDMNWYFAYNFFRLAGILSRASKNASSTEPLARRTLQAMAERVQPAGGMRHGNLRKKQGA